MTIEEAIKTGIRYEQKIHAAYLGAAQRAEDATAKRVFALLAEEERGHVTYLESRLEEWQRIGALSAVTLGTILPSRERVRAGLKRLRTHMGTRKGGAKTELESLRQALAAEDETSDFYRRMVRELPSEGQDLFARFLEIEDGHAALVQAEIDSVNQTGFWFDIKEFDLEVG